LGKRVALAAQAAVYNDSSVIWQAPRASRASMDGSHSIRVEFELREVERLMLNTSMQCPPQILGIYCTGAGFEVRCPSGWVPARSAALVGASVIITANTNATAIDRVRYAYADWPVCSLQSVESGLPARIFDLQIGDAAAPTTPPGIREQIGPYKFTIPVSERDVERLEDQVRDPDGFEGFSWPFLIACSASLFTLVVCVQFCCLKDCRCCRSESRELDADQIQDQALLNKERPPEYRLKQQRGSSRGLKTISP